MSEIAFIYSTFPDKPSALAAAQALVEKHLVACANIAEGVTSVYRWEGKIQQEQEVTFVAKSQQQNVSTVINAIKELHPYAVPCIVSFPITEGPRTISTMGGGRNELKVRYA
jgi:periplasmic divalent cation tolerance protein